jgi:hypothetical protein
MRLSNEPIRIILAGLRTAVHVATPTMMLSLDAGVRKFLRTSCDCLGRAKLRSAIVDLTLACARLRHYRENILAFENSDRNTPRSLIITRPDQSRNELATLAVDGPLPLRFGG